MAASDPPRGSVRPMQMIASACVLVVALLNLGYFGVETTSFAALVAGKPECAGLSALARVVRDELATGAVSRAPSP